MVDERPLPVDLDDRQPLAVGGLELGHAGDVDLAKRKAELLARGLDDRARTVAEMAALRRVEDERRSAGRYG